MLIETDYLNYPPIRNNLTSASLLSIIIEMDYNLVGYESHDRAALVRRNLPRQEYFSFPEALRGVFPYFFFAQSSASSFTEIMILMAI